MKKSLLTLVSVMLTTMSALAQWTDPVPEYTTPSFDGTPQFLYNTGAKGFFCGGNDYNTRASISHTFGDSIYFQPVTGDDGRYYFRCFPSVAKKGFFFFVSANNWDASWVDAPNNGKFNETLEESTAYPGVDKWNLAAQDNGSYKIFNTTEMSEVPELEEGTQQGYYGIAQIFWGGQPDTDTRVWFYDSSRTRAATNDEGEEIALPAFEGLFYDEWRFVSQEAYADWKAKKDIYEAAVALNKAIEEAKATYDGINVADAEAVYNNAASTQEELDKARTELLAADIEAYVQSQIDAATLANPVNVTSRISGIDGTSITDWKRVFIGTGSTGSLSCNTWSTEATEDGMVTPFIENWVGAGSTLSDQKVYRDTVTVKPGAYKITAKARLFNESQGATYLTGANIFANINIKSITKEGVEGPENAIEGANYGDYNGKLYYYKDDFEGYGIVGDDGKLIFGMYIKDANCNWLAHKNYQVYYLGNSYESLDYVRKNSNLLADAYDEDVVGQKTLVAEYNAAVAAYNSATTAEALAAAYAKIVELQDSVADNIAAYKAYTDRLEAISDYMGSEAGASLEGEDVDILTDYLDGDDGPNDDYPNGFSNYILSELTLNTPEIKAELEFLENLYATAIRNGMSDGTDLTDLIVNPGFEEAAGKGWSLDTHNGAATSSLTNWHGGSATNYCAEAYEQNFDVYQIIENVPNGLYEVSVQAFYRTTYNAEAYTAYTSDPTLEGDAKVYSYVYFNSFATPVRNVMEIQFDENLADNCYTIPNSDPTKYTLNGMASASAAFSLPDEDMNFTMKVYGLVTDGKIRLGIRNLDGTLGGRWTLWDNFKLTYRAKNEEAIMSVLEFKIAEYETYVNNAISDDVINSVEQDAATKVLDAADKALKSGTVDEKWDALIAVNDAYVHTQEHVAAVKDVIDALVALDEAINTYTETASQEALDAADAIDDEYDNLTNDEIVALTEQINIAIAKLKIPNPEGASEQNPIDFTQTIVNNGFETGNLTGWVNEGEIAAQAQSNSSFDNKQDNYYAEKWHVNGTVNINQTVAYLPAGYYAISAYVYSSASDAKLFANETEVDVTTSQIYTAVTSVDESGELKFGVKWTDDGNQWTCLDEFTMQYLGTEPPTGIQQVAQKAQEAAKVVAIYTVSGAPVATLQKGLNIVKYADGSVKKIFVK